MAKGTRNEHSADQVLSMVFDEDAAALTVSGGGAGTQYTEGDTDASITGTAMLWEDGSDTLRAASAAKPLPVNVVSGGGGGIADGTAFTTDTTEGTPLMGVYQSSPDTITDEDAAVVAIDVNRNLKTSLATLLGGEDLTNNVMGVIQKPVAGSTYAPSLYAPITQVTKANIKASAGNVKSIYITNDNAAVRYFQLHNKATAPAATEVPLISIKVPAGTANNPGVLLLDEKFFSQAGDYFSLGIGWAVSTTFGTFTDSATNTEHIVVVHYK